jgi:hypothetical protein
LGLLFPIYGKIKHVPNHQPGQPVNWLTMIWWRMVFMGRDGPMSKTTNVVMFLEKQWWLTLIKPSMFYCSDEPKTVHISFSGWLPWYLGSLDMFFLWSWQNIYDTSPISRSLYRPAARATICDNELVVT